MMRFKIILEKVMKGIVATNRTIVGKVELCIFFSVLRFLHLGKSGDWKSLLLRDDDDDDDEFMFCFLSHVNPFYYYFSLRVLLILSMYQNCH